MIGRWVSCFLCLENFYGSCGHATDCFDHLGARISLLKIAGATRGFGLSASGGIVMCGDEDEGRWRAVTDELLCQVDARHAAELDVQHETIKPRLLHIREKCFGRRIGDRMKPGCPQKASKGLAHPPIIICHGAVSLVGTDHRKSHGQRKSRREDPPPVL